MIALLYCAAGQQKTRLHCNGSSKTPMYMKNWVATLDDFIIFRKRNVLHGSGKISKEAMEQRAFAEYAKFNTRRLKSPEQSGDDDTIIDDLNEAAKSKK